MDITQEEAKRLGLSGHDVFIRTHLMYRDPLNRDGMAVYMYREAYRAFCDTFLIQHRRELAAEQEELRRWQSNGGLEDLEHFPLPNYLLAKMELSLFENFKIAAGFELTLKAALLESDFVLHVIERSPAYGALAKAQRQAPILKTDLFQISGYRFNGRQNYLPGLTDQSINFSTILNKAGYRDALPYGSNALDVIDDFRVLRNQIHLPGDAVELPRLASQTTPLVDLLVDFVNRNIVTKVDELLARHALKGRDRLEHLG